MANKVDVLLSMAALADCFDQNGQGACARSLMSDREAVSELIETLRALHDASLPYADGRPYERIGAARTAAATILAQVSP